MKKILSVLIAAAVLLCVFSVSAFAAGGISVSTGSLSLKPGESTSFSVSGSNCAGTFSVSSSDSNVATVSVGGEAWLDNNSATINVTAKNAGTAVITIRATDMTTYDDEDITGQTRTVTINVAAPATTTTAAGGSGTTTTTKAEDKATTMTTAAANELSESIIVAGKKIPLQLASGTYEYDVTVPYGSNTVIVDATAAEESSKVEVVGAENISDGSTVTIVVTGKDGSITNYHVKVHYEEPQIKEVPAEKTGISKGLAIGIAAIAFLLGVLLGLIIGFLLGKRKYEGYDYYGGDGGTTLDYSGPSYNGGSSDDSGLGDSADDYDTGSMSPFTTSGFNFSSGMGLNYDYNKSFDEDDMGYYDESEAQSLRDPVYTAPDYTAGPDLDEPTDVPPAFEVSADEPAPVASPAQLYAEPVAEPEPVAVSEPAAEPQAPIDYLAAMKSRFTAASAEPAEPAIDPSDDLTPEPLTQPYIDDAPPALPYEAGTAFGSVPFEQSAD